MMKFAPQYKPDIISDIASYIYPDMANEAAVTELSGRIQQHITILKNLDVKGIFISFKYVRKLDKRALQNFIKELSDFSINNAIPIGFGEYSHSFFPNLLAMTQASSIGLYKRLNVMALSLGTRTPFSTVLIYLEDLNETNMIASHLISNQYTVIICSNLEELKSRLAGDRKAYDYVVIDSHFGTIQDQVLIRFKKHIFHYTFYGILDESLDKNIDSVNFQEHLDFGYKVFIFDLTYIMHIDATAATYLTSFLDRAQQYKASICLLGLQENRCNSNAYALLKQNGFWHFNNNTEEIYKDTRVMEKIHEQRFQNNPLGISKKIIEFIPHFLKATRTVLSLIGVHELKVNSQQCHQEKQPNIDPYIATHINFEGDYFGEINFIFTRASAHVILENHYDGRNLSKEEHIDALKEFSSTIMEKIKEILERKSMAIEAAFPVATDADHVDLSCTEHKFILETFLCENEPFYVTITDFIPDDHIELKTP